MLSLRSATGLTEFGDVVQLLRNSCHQAVCVLFTVYTARVKKSAVNL